MKIFFGQIYSEPGIAFPFSFVFQRWMGELFSEIAGSAEPRKAAFVGFDLMIRISAKLDLEKPEIRGPSVYKRDKSVEYSVFLPYRGPYENELRSYASTVSFLLESSIKILNELGLDVSCSGEQISSIVERFVSIPEMIK